MAQWVAAGGVAQQTDNLGAHNDGGRGCAGCHAPHSGGRGSGGTTLSSGAVTPYGTAEGDKALWGTDLNPIMSMFNTNFSDNSSGYNVNLTGVGATQISETGAGSSPMISGIAVCLSCHDGNISRGAMMMGISYEQAWGLLNFASKVGLGNQGAVSGIGQNGGSISSVTLYGSAPIPTLLGDDGGSTGDYNNDHPVGYAANIAALFSPQSNGTDSKGYGLTFSLTSSNKLSVLVGGGSQYAQFVDNYGDPQLGKFSVDTVGTGAIVNYNNAFVTCTTCHNQHSMNVYSGTMSGGKGFYPTYFFIAAPYNPGASWSPTAAPSTTQFCRQCHFSHANESTGIMGVKTAY